MTINNESLEVMMTEIAITRLMKNWQEKTSIEIDGGCKLTTANVSYELAGAVEGKTVLDYSMTYFADGSVNFCGYEMLELTQGDKSGSFVLHHEGEFGPSGATMNVKIVTNSGGGDFENVEGSGHIQSDPSDPTRATMVLKFSS